MLLQFHPSFAGILFSGKHTQRDVPPAASAVFRNHPEINLIFSEPLATQPKVIEASQKRIMECPWTRSISVSVIPQDPILCIQPKGKRRLPGITAWKRRPLTRLTQNRVQTNYIFNAPVSSKVSSVVLSMTVIVGNTTSKVVSWPFRVPK